MTNEMSEMSQLIIWIVQKRLEKFMIFFSIFKMVALSKHRLKPGQVFSFYLLSPNPCNIIHTFMYTVWSLIRAPPIVWSKQKVPKMTKVSVTFLRIDRFSIRNLRWKAQNISFNSLVSDFTLSERLRPY